MEAEELPFPAGEEIYRRRRTVRGGGRTMELMKRAWIYQEGSQRIEVANSTAYHDTVEITVGGETIRIYKQGLPALAQIFTTIYGEWALDQG